jgi:hypothetical protein
VSDLAPEIPNVTIRNFCIGVNGGVIATHALFKFRNSDLIEISIS